MALIPTSLKKNPQIINREDLTEMEEQKHIHLFWRGGESGSALLPKTTL
jgi:hypothetical protein